MRKQIGFDCYKFCTDGKTVWYEISDILSPRELKKMIKEEVIRSLKK
jgi:hypothetical protein